MNIQRIKCPGDFNGATHFAEVSYTNGDFDAAATTETITLKSLAKGDIVFPAGCFVVVEDGLNGGSVSAATVELGLTGDTDRILDTANCFDTTDEGKTLVQSVSADNLNYAATSAIDLLCTVKLTGGNSSTLTGGKLWVYLNIAEAAKINTDLEA